MENNTFVTTENGTANYDWKAIAKANEERYANQQADSKKSSQKQYLTDITAKYASEESTKSAVDFQLMLDTVSYIKKDFLVEIAAKIKADVQSESAKIKKMRLLDNEKRVATETAQRRIAKKYLTEINEVVEEYRDFAKKNREVCRRELLKEPQATLDDLSYAESAKAIKDFTRSISLYPNVRKVDEFVDSYRQKYETDAVAMMSLLDALPPIIGKIEMTKEQQQELEALLLDVEKLSKTQEQQLAEAFLAMSSDYETFKLANDYAAAAKSIQYYLTKYARFINKPLEGLAQIQQEENEFQRKFVDSYL